MRIIVRAFRFSYTQSREVDENSDQSLDIYPTGYTLARLVKGGFSVTVLGACVSAYRASLDRQDDHKHVAT